MMGIIKSMDSPFMYTLKYTIESPETMTLLQKFCPEEKREFDYKKIKRPSLPFRRAVVLALVRRSLIEMFQISLAEALSICIHRETSGAPYLVLPETVSLPFKIGGCKSLTQVGYLFYVLQNFLLTFIVEGGLLTTTCKVQEK